ncbi:MAG: hypothetical protein ACXABU_12615 [Candidatus Hodarchaeales archaeon]|jgi:hypothetical protein
MKNILDYWITSPILVITVTLLLALLDLRLLPKSNRLRKQGHNIHYIQPFFHINPAKAKLLKEDGILFSKTWIFQVLSLILLTGLGSFLITSKWNEHNSLINAGSELMIGIIVGHQIRTILSQYRNIGFFDYIKHNPNEIQGKIIVKKEFLYLIFRVDLLGEFLLWFIIFLVGRRLFFLGGMISILLIFCASFFWEQNQFPASIDTL